MTTELTDTHPTTDAAGPLALKSNEGLGPRLRNMAAAGRMAFELVQRQQPEADRMAFIGPHICEEAADELDRRHAVVAEFVAAYDEYNGAIGLNGTQAENEALLYRVAYRHGAAWKALRGLVGPNV